MEIFYTLKNEDIIAFTLYHHTVETNHQEKNYMKIVLIISVIGFFILLSLTKDLGLASFSGAFALIILSLFRKQFLTRTIKKEISKQLNNNTNEFTGECVFTISDSEINTKNLTNNTSTNITSIDRIREDNDRLYIYIGAVTAFVIPANTFNNATEKDLFITKLNDFIAK